MEDMNEEERQKMADQQKQLYSFENEQRNADELE